MSTNADETSDTDDTTAGGDSGPGTREVAYRLFATEFDDATLSYSESDEERAPNYVVTPTGLRVNRLFAVGVLTEVERLNTDTLRGRIVDPTGAFVTYAGQYQPEAQAFLDSAESPSFVSITGKARTFEPDDSDQIFTSVRPESLSEVTADTRDRWTVSAAEATLDRIAVFAAALDSGRTGDDLHAALTDAGVDASLAAGIPRAIDHYGTTTAYLDAIRQCAVDALEVVADERDEVRPVDIAPDAGGAATLGSLPDIDLDLSAGAGGDVTAAGEAATDEAATGDSTPTETGDAETETETTEAATPEDSTASTDSAGEPTESTPTDTPTAGDDEAHPAETADSETEPATTSTATDTAKPATADTPTESPAAETTPSATEAESTTTAEPESSLSASADTERDTTTETEADTNATTDSETAESEDASGEPEMYQLDEDEREELESEYGAGFSSGNEVDPAGEADIDVPDADELAAEAEAESESPTDTESTTTDSPASESTPTESTADTGTLGSFEDTVESDDDSDGAAADTAPPDEPADDTAESDAAEAGDVDLEDAAVELMSNLDDGDGADREAVVAAVVDEHGVDSAAVEDAIDDALMGGRCYEPDDGTLKPI